MSEEFTEQQLEFRSLPSFSIYPSFNGEWVIEVYNHNGDLEGRFNVTDSNTLIWALRAEVTGKEGPPGFETN